VLAREASGEYMNNLNFIKEALSNLSGEIVIWIIFSFMFVYFSYSEYFKSKKELDVKEINLGFTDLNEAYNATRKAIIISDKQSHSTASISYFLAFLTAVGSLILSITK
jgi:hypothetical protein